MSQVAHQERRQHPRHSADFSIEIKIENQASSQYVELRDISEGGLSFMVDDLDVFHESQRLCVSIPQYSDGLLEYQHLQAEIAWLQEKDLLNPRAWVGLRIIA